MTPMDIFAVLDLCALAALVLGAVGGALTAVVCVANVAQVEREAA